MNERGELKGSGAALVHWDQGSSDEIKHFTGGWLTGSEAQSIVIMMGTCMALELQ